MTCHNPSRLALITASAKRHPEKWSSVVSSRRGSGTYVDVKLGWTEDWRTVYWALLWSGAGIIVSASIVLVRRFLTTPLDPMYLPSGRIRPGI